MIGLQEVDILASDLVEVGQLGCISEFIFRVINISKPDISWPRGALFPQAMVIGRGILRLCLLFNLDSQHSLMIAGSLPLDIKQPLVLFFNCPVTLLLPIPKHLENLLHVFYCTGSGKKYPNLL